MTILTRRVAAGHARANNRSLLAGALLCPVLALFSFQAYAADSDGDGVNDVVDNCLLVSNPDQFDSDSDDYGNRCDADLNNDLMTNFADLALFKANFLSSGQLAADFNGDGVVNFADLAFMKAVFLQPPGPSGIVSGGISLKAERRFSNLSYFSTIAMLQAPGNSSHWYLVRQNGEVRRFANSDSVSSSSLALNVNVSFGGEAGLLGMAFHPDFASNGHVYLNFTRSGSPLVSHIARFTSYDGGVTFDPASEETILTLSQPYTNHNGGNLAFGPDGYLYAGFGDGGSFGDPQGHGQNTNTLLGTIIRIDVNVSQADWDEGVRYYIPSDNPFAGNASCGSGSGCPEIFAWGLRNPWRWSFDEQSGKLWVGDVGQDAREEIHVVELGGNYGWRCYEGNLPYNTSGCGESSSYEFPVHDYDHGLGGAVAGGFVYRGSLLPQLYGVYLFGDIQSGRIWGITPEGNVLPDELLDVSFSFSSFAQGHDGEIYLLSLSNGGIYRLEPQ